MLERIPALLSLALLAAVPADAAFLGNAALAARSPAMPWIAPIARAFRDYGPAKVPGLDSPALTHLAAVDPDFSLRVESANAFQMERLARRLAARVADPRAFAEEPVERRMEALAAAAREAETGASAEAEAFLARMGEGPLRCADVERFEYPVKTLWFKDVLNIRPRLRERLHARLQELERLHALRDRLVEEHRRELPRRLMRGDFDGSNYAKEDGLWRAADASPVPVHPTLEDAFRERIAEIDNAPAGPWSNEILSGMERALKDASVLRHLEAEGGEPTRLRLSKSVAEARSRLESKGGAVPAPRALRPLYDWSDRLVNYSGSESLRARILHRLYSGGDGLPGWEQLKEAKDAAVAALARRVWYARAAAALGVAGLFLLPHGGAWTLATVVFLLGGFVAAKLFRRLHERLADLPTPENDGAFRPFADAARTLAAKEPGPVRALAEESGPPLGQLDLSEARP